MAMLLHDIHVRTEGATFAMACFKACDALFGIQKGVIRTRVGYVRERTVKALDEYLWKTSEAIEIEYDPSEISYRELLGMFWKNHDPTAYHEGKPFASIILYRDREQKQLAEETLKEEEQKKSAPILTKILPVTKFYKADDCVQKYHLRQHPSLMQALGFLNEGEIVRSHLAARLNGYIAGRGDVSQFDAEVSHLGLSEETADYVRQLVVKYEGHGQSS